MRAIAPFTACLLGLFAGPTQEPEIPKVDMRGMRAAVREVLEDARAAVARKPDDGAAWARLGAVFDAHQLFTQAELAYARARILVPDDFRYAYLEATVAELVGREPEQVVLLLHQAAELEPTYLPVHVALGRTLANNGRLEEACAAYARALEGDATYRAALLGLGQALLSHGQAEAALEPLEAAARLAPEDRAGQSALARAYMRVGRRDEARVAAARSRVTVVEVDERDVLRREVADQGSSSFVAYNRGLAAMAEMRYADAITDFTIFLERRPESPAVHAQLGRAYLLSNKRRESRTHLRRALELSPGRIDARIGMVRLQLFGRDPNTENLAKELTAILRESPNMAEGHGLMGVVEFRRGNWEEALRRFERAEPGRGLGTFELDLWGVALLELGRDADAAARLLAAINRNPRFPPLHAHLGLAYERLGKPREALKHYREALRLDPAQPVADRIRALEKR